MKLSQLFLALLLTSTVVNSAQVTINRGAYLNDPNAESIYSAFGKINTNFNWLFTRYNNEMVSVKQSPFNAVGDGVADDTSAIQAALNYYKTLGIKGTVYIPSGTYKMSYISNDVSYVSIKSDGAILQCTGTNGAALRLYGSVNPPYYQATTIIEGFLMKGMCTNLTCVGILEQSYVTTGAGPSHITYRNLDISGFGTGIKQFSYAYVNNYYSVDIHNCFLAYLVASGGVDYGERNSFFGCTIYNNYFGMYIMTAGAEIHMNQCSLDYNGQAIYTEGRMYLTSCHVETGTSVSTTSPGLDNIYVTGNSSHFSMLGGYYICSDRITNATYHIGTEFFGSAVFDNVFIYNTYAQRDYFGYGDLVVLNTRSYAQPQNPILLSTNNMEANGSFEVASTNAYPFITITQGGVITNRFDSAGMMMYATNTIAYAGTNSLVAVKSYDSTNSTKFRFYIPARFGENIGWRGYFAKPGTTNKVTLSLKFGYAALVKYPASSFFADQLIAKEEFFAKERLITSTGAAIPWTKMDSGGIGIDPPLYGADGTPLGFTFKIPHWADHAFVEFYLYDTDAGEYYFDDFIVTKY